MLLFAMIRVPAHTRRASIPASAAGQVPGTTTALGILDALLLHVNKGDEHRARPGRSRGNADSVVPSVPCANVLLQFTSMSAWFPCSRFFIYSAFSLSS